VDTIRQAGEVSATSGPGIDAAPAPALGETETVPLQIATTLSQQFDSRDAVLKVNKT